MNWFAIEPKSAAPDRYAAVSQIWQRRLKQIRYRMREKEQKLARKKQLRARRRSAYRPLQLPPAPDQSRRTIDMSGNWLALPQQQRPEHQQPYKMSVTDEDWHVIDVPCFIRPVSWWIYGPNQGTSDNWVQSETERCESCTFDYNQTDAIWLRKWFHVPQSYAGKTARLKFRAVAAVSQVWLNDTHIGGHVGMFGPFELDAMDVLRPGELNCITVFAGRGEYRGKGDPTEVLGTAVTVEVTREMLNSLPHGMYGRNLGIWQPVELIVSGKQQITDVWLTPSLTALKGQLQIRNCAADTARLKPHIRITERNTGELLHERDLPQIAVGANNTATLEFSIGGLDPKPWSPEKPNLYDAQILLQRDSDGHYTDSCFVPVGFRTFEVRGNRFYLNGKPYWLRGANHCTHGLRPNDSKLARTFLHLMHHGNTMITRTHGSCFSEVWLDAADELGVGVSMEGIWPWTMISDRPVPSRDLIDAWESEWIDVIKSCRNHPSILMWTLNNESYWYRDRNDERRKKKWAVATELIKAMRQADPSRPIVPDSGYVRNPDTYTNEIKPNAFDDGDVDDRHMYYGWYSISPFRLYGRQMERVFSGRRPAISQEISTGYPNQDTGHPTRKYIDRNYVAQAWCGDWAYEDRDVSVFLRRHAFISKELGELGRRERDKICGLSHFANCCWWQDSFVADPITPYPVYDAMQTALQPILISMEMRNRHFYAGHEMTGRLCIVHDAISRDLLTDLTIRCSILTEGDHVIAAETLPVPDTPYYGNTWVDFHLPVPSDLPAPKRAYTLALDLFTDKENLSHNGYPIVLADRDWAARQTPDNVVVVRASDIEAGLDRDALNQYARQGKNILALNAGKQFAQLLPDVIGEYVRRDVEVANMEVPTHTLFDYLQPLELSWFNSPEGEPPIVAKGAFRLKPDAPARQLMTTIWSHGYLGSPTDVQRHTGVLAFEMPIGDGRLLALEVSDHALDTDPLAARLSRNALTYLSQM